MKYIWKIIFFVFAIIYRLSLDWIYFNVINKFYEYSGFIINSNLQNLILSWGLFIITLILMYKIFFCKNERNSSLIISILYLISFIPFTTCIYAGLVSYELIFLNTVFWLIIIIMQRKFQKKTIKKPLKIKFGNIEINDKFIIFIGLLSLGLLIYISGKYAHFRFNFNLFSVYDLRLEAREFSYSPIIAYLFAWSRIINQILLSYCLIKKKRGLSIFLFFIQMLNFGIDGSKTVFFMTILSVILVLFIRNFSYKKIIVIILIVLTIIMLISILEGVLFNTYYIAEIFTRRIMFVPNYLHECYFDFFSVNQPDYFRSTALKFLNIESPYSKYNGIPYLIGTEFFNQPEMSCNNGLFSDAITNFGKIGVVFMPIILIYVLRLFDKTSEGLDKRISLIIVIWFVINIISSSLTTVLVTHGLLIVFVVMMMFNRDKIEMFRENSNGRK